MGFRAIPPPPAKQFSSRPVPSVYTTFYTISMPSPLPHRNASALSLSPEGGFFAAFPRVQRRDIRNRQKILEHARSDWQADVKAAKGAPDAELQREVLGKVRKILEKQAKGVFWGLKRLGLPSIAMSEEGGGRP